MGQFSFQLTGFFGLRTAGGQTLRPTGQKPAALLGYLAYANGREVTRERLIDLLWSDRGEKQGKDSLRQALYTIRSTLKAVAPDMLVTNRYTVSLNPEGVSFDLWHPDGTLNEKCDGTLLEDLNSISPVFDDWLTQARRELRQRQVLQAERILNTIDSAAHPDDALELTKSILKLDPTNEPAARMAISIHGERDEVGHAQRIFNSLRTELRADDLDVSHRTIEVFEGIGVSARPAAQVATLPKSIEPNEVFHVPLLEVTLERTPQATEVTDEFMDELIARLSQMPELRVRIGASGKPLSPQEFRLMVFPSSRQASTSVAARLQNGEGEIVWSHRAGLPPDPTGDEIDVVVDTLVINMLPALEEHIYRRIRREPVTAFEHYLFARRHYIEANDDNYIENVVKHLERCVELDPEFLPAMEKLVMHYNTGRFMSQPGTDHSGPREKAYKLAQRLLFINSRYPNGHVRMAWCLLWRESYQSAERSLRKGMELKPYDPHMLNVTGTALVYLGDLDTAERYYKMSQERSLHDMDFIRTDFGELYYLRGDFETALSWLETLEVRTPYRALFWRIPTYAQLGLLAEAQQDIHDMFEDLRKRWRGPQEFNPEAAVQWMCDMKPYRRAEDRDLLVDGFNKAGIPITSRNFPSI